MHSASEGDEERALEVIGAATSSYPGRVGSASFAAQGSSSQHQPELSFGVESMSSPHLRHGFMEQ